MNQEPVQAGSRAALREVQLGLALAVEAGWLFAWSAVLGGWIEPNERAPILGLPTIAGLLVAAAMVTRLALGRRDHLSRWRAAVSLLGLGLALLAAATAVLPPAWPADWPAGRPLIRSTTDGLQAIETATLVLLAWWRGIIAGRMRLSADTAELGLRLAVGALVLLFLLQTFAPRDDRSDGTLAGAALLVLAAGLIGLPLAALQDQRESARQEGAPAPRIGPHWLGLLVCAVGALLLLGLFVAQLLTFERLDYVLQPLSMALGALLWILAYAVAIPLGLLVELLIWLLASLLSLVGRRQPLSLSDLSWLDELREQVDREGLVETPIFMILGLIAGGVVAVLVAWLLARAVLRWADPDSGDGIEELRDFVWSWEGLWGDLRRWLRALRPHQSQRPADEPLPIGIDEPPGSPARGVRELYRELLHLGARLGRRRAIGETPYEYERALAVHGPLVAGRTDVRRLTEIYTRARYSAASPTPSAVAEARAALERLTTLADPSDEIPDTPDGGSRSHDSRPG